MLNKKTSFIYFDMGGVVILDFSGTDKWTQMKKGLHIPTEKYSAFNRVWDIYKDLVCVDVDVDSIIPQLEEAVGIKFPAGYSMLDDFVNRFVPNPSIWPVIHKLKRKYKIGLLTNMYPRMLDGILRKHGLVEDISWDVVIDSSCVRCRKPQNQIYQYAEEKADADPEEILFIDNQQKNLDPAQKRGWATFLYDPVHPEESTQAFARFFTM